MPRRPAKKRKPTRKSAALKPQPQPTPVVAERPAPKAAPPSVQTLPQRPTNKSYYHSAVIFALGIVTVAALLFAVVREVGTDRTPPQPQAEVDDPLFVELRARTEFKAWFSAWRTIDPYVSVAEFAELRRSAVQTARPPEFAVAPPPESLLPPRSNRYVWSPDRSRYVDYLGSYGEPDGGVEVYDRMGDGKLEMLAYCGTPCRFDGAFWLDDDRVVVLGAVESQKDDGTPLCLPHSDDPAIPRKCYERLTLTVYDFGKNEQVAYRSENHLFVSNPFENDSRERWVSGLTADERAVAGLSRPGDVEILRGAVLDVTADARIITLDGDKVRRFVAVSTDAAVTSETGSRMPFEALQKGFIVEARAVTQADGSMLATSVRVLIAPNIIVHEPSSDADVGTRFTVRGVARVFEGNVQLLVKNDRTDKTLLERYTTAAAEEPGAFGPFSIELRVPSGTSRTGDGLTLSVYATSAEDGTVRDAVSIPLKYRP